MLIGQPGNMPPSPVMLWRDKLHQQQAALRLAFAQKPHTAKQLRQLCKLVDVMLKDLWQQSGLADNVCLIAVGGYGRGELFPHSDVDLLILLPESAGDTVNHQIELLIGQLWDVGLNIGHSVRSLEECLVEAKKMSRCKPICWKHAC